MQPLPPAALQVLVVRAYETTQRLKQLLGGQRFAVPPMLPLNLVQPYHHEGPAGEALAAGARPAAPRPHLHNDAGLAARGSRPAAE